jgi:hypothetical protein
MMLEKNNTKYEKLEFVGKQNMINEKNALSSRLKNLLGKKYIESNDDEFDLNLKQMMEHFDQLEENMIKQDHSYNLVHIPEYEFLAKELLKEL